jgi:probable HAF family extracellular repeat protein
MRYTAPALLLLPALLLACHDEPVAPDAGSSDPPALDKPGTKPGSGGSTTITNLNLSGSGQDSRAEDISASGRIVGWRGPWSGPNSAFVWTPATDRGATGTATTLASLGNEALAYAVNVQGYVAGERGRAGVEMQHPVLWRPLPGGGYSDPFELGSALDGGSVFDLGDFDAGSQAVAVGASDIRINPRAIAWGLSRDAGGAVSVSMRWVLPPIIEGQGGTAFEVNRLGQAVGYANRSSTENRPVRWTYSSGAWGLLELPTLAGATGGVARGINAAGQVVGFDFMGAGRCERAFVWTPAGTTADATLRQLPPLAGSLCDLAYAINDAGQVAGTSGGHTVLWTLGSTISVRDLGNLSGTAADEGMALNEPLAGATEVAGYGRTGNGAEEAALWTMR